MRSKIGIFLMSLGTVLILSALFLFLWNRWEDKHAGEMANLVVAKLENHVSATEPPPEATTAPTIAETTLWTYPEPATQPTGPMPEVEIDGERYIGYVSIPALELKLPVMSRWSYPRLKIAPCRYQGSAYTNDLIIMAHNYQSHFGGLLNLSQGDLVHITDTQERAFSYEVAEVEILDGAELESLVSGDWDLTLFTCTVGGKARVTVRCVQSNET